MKRLMTIILIGGLSIFWLPATGQETQIRGFTDVQFGTVKRDTARDKSQGFMVGQFDLFITSQVTDKITFLGETVFEWDDADGSYVVDLERLIIKYRVNDYFNVSAGKFHTPFGYWNNAYHHGSLIQPTIQRPAIVRFEDEGGFLPVHQVGLMASGQGISKYNMGYAVMVSNGLEKGNSGGDAEYRSAALSGNLSIEPVENLKFIGSLYSTSIPKGTVTYQGIQLNQAFRYTMSNVAIAYFDGLVPVEFAAEYYNIGTQGSGAKSNMQGFFVYAGFTKFKIIPYTSFSKITYEKSEEYFFNNNYDGWLGGLRYSFSPTAVLKAEYGQEKTVLGKGTQRFQVQFAIGF